MRVLGIIGEYNPFHYGHRYHISQSKEENHCDYSVVIMSGCMVQRGEFAILQQHRRAKIAVEHGADLVLELPICYSSQSADIFSLGSVNILDRLGFVDLICCGSETNSLEDIKTILPFITEEDINYIQSLKSNLAKGISFPKARSHAIFNLTGIEISKSPNDILAFEYAKTLKKINSPIILKTILRQGQGYSSTNLEDGFASATGIRKMFENGSLNPDLAPLSTISALQSHGKLIDSYHILQGIIFREGHRIKDIFDLNEGMENSILTHIKKSQSKKELISLLKSKRYTHTRISRLLNNILIGLDKVSMREVISSSEKPYARLLAFNSKGRELLAKIPEDRLTLINKPANFEPENRLQNILWRYDEVANNMYLALSKESFTSCKQISPIYCQESHI